MRRVRQPAHLVALPARGGRGARLRGELARPALREPAPALTAARGSTSSPGHRSGPVLRIKPQSRQRTLSARRSADAAPCTALLRRRAARRSRPCAAHRATRSLRGRERLRPRPPRWRLCRPSRPCPRARLLPRAGRVRLCPRGLVCGLGQVRPRPGLAAARRSVPAARRARMAGGQVRWRALRPLQRRGCHRQRPRPRRPTTAACARLRSRGRRLPPSPRRGGGGSTAGARRAVVGPRGRLRRLPSRCRHRRRHRCDLHAHELNQPLRPPADRLHARASADSAGAVDDQHWPQAGVRAEEGPAGQKRLRVVGEVPARHRRVRVPGVQPALGGCACAAPARASQAALRCRGGGVVERRSGAGTRNEPLVHVEERLRQRPVRDEVGSAVREAQAGQGQGDRRHFTSDGFPNSRQCGKAPHCPLRFASADI